MSEPIPTMVAREVRRERAMTRASDSPGLPPVAPMSLPARLRAVREFHTGPAVVRDVAGPEWEPDYGPCHVVDDRGTGVELPHGT